jgi:hypothetical protein
MNSQVVQIGKPKPRARWAERLYKAPLVHKFFLLGALFGLIGTAWLGVHMWLMLNGQLEMQGLLYFIFKQLHALVQMDLFLGLFIVGFLLQTAPKLFEIPDPTPRWSLWILVPMLLAGFCLIVFPHQHLHRYLLAVSFFSTAAVFCTYYRRATLQNRLRLGVLSIFGLCVLGFSPFVDISNPLTALAIFWCGVFAIIIAVSQQFIIWVLGGLKLQPAQSSIMLVLFFCASASVVLALTFPNFLDLGIRPLAIFSLLTLLYFFLATRAAVISWRKLSEPLALAFSMSQFWAITGAGILFLGVQHADATLHLWATGVAVTLILAVSCRVVGVLSGNEVFGSRVLVSMLLFWQIVPFGRGLRGFLALPAWFSWITGAAAIGVFCVWSAAIFWRIAQIINRQLALRRGEQMLSC